MKPRIYIPTLYFIEGLPYTIVNMMSVVFFKNLQASNEFIGVFTSWLQLPWVIKALWAPLVDLKSTRRQWIVVSQLVLTVLSAALAAAVYASFGTYALLVIFIMIAFTSATQDIAIDGYYMDVLDRGEQAFYVGVRNAAYKVAWLLGQGGLVVVAGKVAESGLGVRAGWCTAFAVCCVLFLIGGQFHRVFLPVVQKVETDRTAGSQHSWREVFSTFFQQTGIVPIVTYILIFRLGDALMLKMAQPFLLDPIEKGGLHLSTSDVGLVYGTAGTASLLAGGLVGGWLVSRFGLRRCLMPTAIAQNSAILLYWLLAVWKPSLPIVAVVNGYEQFSYGLGVSAYTVFLLSTVSQEYKAAHYAIATALMALGVMLPGTISGYLTTWFGYQTFFLLSFASSVPGIITILYLPLKKDSN